MKCWGMDILIRRENNWENEWMNGVLEMIEPPNKEAVD